MSFERQYLEMASKLLKLGADAVALAHSENEDRGSLLDIERDILKSHDACEYLIDIIENNG